MSTANDIGGIGTHRHEKTVAFTAATGRQFGLTVGIAFLVVSGIAMWRGTLGAPTGPRVLAGIGVAMVLAGLAIPAALGPVYRAWMGLAFAMSKVTMPLFMSIVYFVVFLPIGALMRLFGRAPLRTTPSESYWVRRERGVVGDLRRQF